jgi:hypothetical protein
MRYLPAAALLLLATACGDNSPPPPEITEDTTQAAQMPAEPHVMAIDMGIAVDDSGRIMGVGVETFPSPDTVYVAVRTQAAPEGSAIGVRLLSGERTVDSTGTTTGAMDADGVGRASVSFPQAVTLAPGDYRLEVFLNGTSAGIREFRFSAP